MDAPFIVPNQTVYLDLMALTTGKINAEDWRASAKHDTRVWMLQNSNDFAHIMLGKDFTFEWTERTRSY